VTLRVFDLGRAKKSAQFIVDDGLDADGVAEEIYRAVKRMKALMSRDIECQWDAEGKRGAVYAGMRLVGQVEVLS
jgi:hypothetical protein